MNGLKKFNAVQLSQFQKSTDATLDFIEDEDEVLVKVPPHEHTIVKEG